MSDISNFDDIDWGEDADKLLACGIENPETCESCE